MARFSDIQRAAELQAAAVALAQWQALDRAAKKAAYATATQGNGGRVKTQRIIGYIKPFGILATDDVFLETLILGTGTPTVVTGEETAADMVGVLVPAIGPMVKATKADTDIAFPNKKFKFAKVSIKNKTTQGGSQKTSRFTKNTYTAYPSQTVSAPFGQSTTNDSFEKAADAIGSNGNLVTWLNAEGAFKRSIRFVPQLTVIKV